MACRGGKISVGREGLHPMCAEVPSRLGLQIRVLHSLAAVGWKTPVTPLCESVMELYLYPQTPFLWILLA